MMTAAVVCCTHYIGDALLQKTYVVDCLTKEIRKNNGEIPQYMSPGTMRRLFQGIYSTLFRRKSLGELVRENRRAHGSLLISKYHFFEKQNERIELRHGKYYLLTVVGYFAEEYV